MPRSMVRRLAGVVLAVVLIGWSGAPVRAASHSVADMGLLKGHVGAIAYAINNDGVVVGQSVDKDGVNHAVRLRDGKLRDLDINEKLVVVGAARDLGATREEDGPARAIVWEKSKPSELPSLGGDISQALTINSDGVIVGHSTVEQGEDAVSHDCRWVAEEAGDLGILGGYSVANDVNDKGWIVGGANSVEGAETQSPGAHAVMWKDDELIDLGTLPGGEIAQARAINERGQIVGIGYLNGEQRGFILTPEAD